MNHQTCFVLFMVALLIRNGSRLSAHGLELGGSCQGVNTPVLRLGFPSDVTQLLGGQFKFLNVVLWGD